MKLSFTLLVSCLASAAGASLRATGDCGAATTKETCQASTDPDAHEPCVWCTSQAVKSACFTKEQSEALPASVFHCESPGKDEEPEFMKPFASDEKLGLTRSSFSFLEGDDTTHHLLHKVHQPGDDAICDGSSKSISGYMDIKGSKYDDNNDKHLFFWMFEKRPSEDTVEDEDVPFVVWLTGGPGCSSTLALLTENGPCSVNKDGEGTSVNPYRYVQQAKIVLSKLMFI